MELPSIITSKSNETVKWLSSLSQKKYRDMSHTFLAYGDKLAKEAISAGTCVTHIIAREDRAKEMLCPPFSALIEKDTKAIVLSSDCFDKITSENSPDGIIVAVKYLDNYNKYYIMNKDIFYTADMGGTVFIDGVRDPGNLGAILRSAAAFGVTDIVITDDCADIYHPRTLRAAMGGLFSLRTHTVTDMAQAIAIFRKKNRRVFAAELRDTAVPFGSVSLTPRDAVVVGNEGHGISSEISAACDGSIYIPISQKVESLNASVAASLLIFAQMTGE